MCTPRRAYGEHRVLLHNTRRELVMNAGENEKENVDENEKKKNVDENEKKKCRLK